MKRDEIENLIKESHIYVPKLDEPFLSCLVNQIESLHKAELLKELELARGKEILNMYHNGGFITKLEWIDHRIKELSKEIERAK